MSSAARILLQLEQKATNAESLIVTLKNELERTQSSAAPNQLATLKLENEKLKQEVEVWKQKLVQAGLSHGVRCFSTSATCQPLVAEKVEKPTEKAEKPAEKAVVSSHPDSKKAKETKKKDSVKTAEVNKVEIDDGPVDIGRIDLRIGKIVAVKKHPDADSLYVEEVDVGEGKTRTIVSGLVKHVPIEEMQDRIAIFMCNLKPAKMRGITSEGMLMCASTPEKVEILLAPNGAVPGDLVEAEGYARRPDAVLNPKKKIWEAVAPDLKTNNESVATYKGAVLSVPNKGPISAPTLANVQIK
ncbi:aminoacyl tRNA synthase complex-interacting multifunctional protein 1-like isoform X2 [Daphnia pulex]|uniref:aminoacyl tRNA synthase complex-interacting multifunctional protein 1-like isoform X2 n=1 Tax=Daphnia pulex TaxID=6669 RepID=UPI001EE03C0B|nr:aminoacyl tRNA synthase complex-interacting multifunctional protein 1-like isoform X2 [Daphnia pulex]